MQKWIAFMLRLLCTFITLLLVISPSQKFAMDQRNYRFPELAFSVISDLHLHGVKASRGTLLEDKQGSWKFANALQDLNQINSAQNALVINGDITVTGMQPDYDIMRNILNKAPHPADTFFTIGNHEFYSALRDKNGNLNLKSFPNGVTEQQCIRRFLDNTGMQNVYYDRWISGYHFIMLGSEESRITNRLFYDNPILTQTQLHWLDMELSKSPINKPTFVFLHQPVPYISFRKNDMYRLNAYQLKQILLRHPQVILFAGHSHETLYEENQIPFSGSLIMFNDSSVRNPLYGPHHLVGDSEGLYVEVFHDKVVVKGRDFTHKLWIGQTSVPIVTASPPTFPFLTN